MIDSTSTVRERQQGRPGEPGIDLYSNFDHEWDSEGRQRILEGSPAVFSHPAWDYHGSIWRDGDLFCEEVRCYGSVVAIYESNDLDALIEHVLEEHGRD